MQTSMGDPKCLKFLLGKSKGYPNLKTELKKNTRFFMG